MCHHHCHAGEYPKGHKSRHPELTENTGFRVALRLHGMTIIVIATQSHAPGFPAGQATAMTIHRFFDFVGNFKYFFKYI